MQLTEFSNALNSSSFNFLYEAISLSASARASFNLCTLSGSMLAGEMHNHGKGAYTVALVVPALQLPSPPPGEFECLEIVARPIVNRTFSEYILQCQKCLTIDYAQMCAMERVKLWRSSASASVIAWLHLDTTTVTFWPSPNTGHNVVTANSVVVVRLEGY